jgi:hypothetical protein
MALDSRMFERRFGARFLLKHCKYEYARQESNLPLRHTTADASSRNLRSGSCRPSSLGGRTK